MQRTIIRLFIFLLFLLCAEISFAQLNSANHLGFFKPSLKTKMKSLCDLHEHFLSQKCLSITQKTKK